MSNSSQGPRQDSQEVALRSHIRTLLLDYALSHLTTDYVAFTEDATAEACTSSRDIFLLIRVPQLLSGNLLPVITCEATNLVLQPTLQEAINTGLQLKEISSYDERWMLDPEASKFLQACFTVIKGSPATARCWEDSPDGVCMILISTKAWFTKHPVDNWRKQRPMSPVLTLRSLRETPKTGSTPLETICPGPTAVLLESLHIHKVPVTRTDNLPQVDLKDALYVHKLVAAYMLLDQCIGTFVWVWVQTS